MKKIFFIALALIATITTVNAQSYGNRGMITKEIGAIKIKSKIALEYDSRSQLKDTIYVTIKKWTYDPVTLKYSALVTDYIKKTDSVVTVNPETNASQTVYSVSYKSINEKVKLFTKAQVDGLFTLLNNPISINESYSAEMDKLLINALLIDTQTNLLPDGKTIYGGLPANWELITD